MAAAYKALTFSFFFPFFCFVVFGMRCPHIKTPHRAILCHFLFSLASHFSLLSLSSQFSSRSWPSIHPAPSEIVSPGSKSASYLTTPAQPVRSSVVVVVCGGSLCLCFLWCVILDFARCASEWLHFFTFIFPRAIFP